MEVRGSGNGVALFSPEKLWDPKPEHQGVFGEDRVSVGRDGRICHRKPGTLYRSPKEVTAIIVTFSWVYELAVLALILPQVFQSHLNVAKQKFLRCSREQIYKVDETFLWDWRGWR